MKRVPERGPEENLAILAALLVLVTAMLHPVVSAALALALLLFYAFYRWRRRSRTA
jgi:hypothetical protein